MKVHRFTEEPDRPDLKWEQSWQGEDDGLVRCWEVGRAMRLAKPMLAEAASCGALVELPWKGGVRAGQKAKKKFGSLYYLAMWQGLAGVALEIETTETTTLTCSATGVAVTFTADASLWAGADGGLSPQELA